MRFFILLAFLAMSSPLVQAQTIVIDLPLLENPFDNTFSPTSNLPADRYDCGDGVPDYSLFENTTSGSACPASVAIAALLYPDRDLTNTPLGPFDLGVPLTVAQLPDESYTVRLTATDDCGGTGTLDYTLFVGTFTYFGAPNCVPPPNVDINCNDLEATYGTVDLETLSASELDAGFGAPAGFDPCVGGLTASQRITGDINVCGVGNFVRTFTITNANGNTNAQACVQRISVSSPDICTCPDPDFLITPDEPDFRDGSYHLDWYDCDGTQNFSFSEPISDGPCRNNNYNTFTLYLDQDPNQLVGTYLDGEIVSPPIPPGTHTVLLIHLASCGGDGVAQYTLTVTRIDGNGPLDINLTSQEEVDLFLRQWSYGSCSDLGNLTIGSDGDVGQRTSTNTPISDLSGFSTIAPLTLSGDLTISNTTDLASLDGLEAIRSVGGDITLQDNSQLADISALDAAAAAGSTAVSLSGNNALPVCGNPTLCIASENGATINLDPTNLACDTNMEFEASCKLLPVTWQYFRGAVDGKLVLLNWATVGEIDNRGFYVERNTSRTASNQWITLGFIPANGEEGDYQFVDATPLPGVNIYRLRQVDIDGTEAFSHLIDVTLSANNLQIYPNPAHEELHVLVPGQEVTQVRIFNSNGQVVRAQQRGNTVVVSDLPAGLYFAEVSTMTATPISRRFIIAH